MPALKAAQSAVDNLDPKDIQEMKANNKPSLILKYILESVGIFFITRLGPVKFVSVPPGGFIKKD